MFTTGKYETCQNSYHSHIFAYEDVLFPCNDEYGDYACVPDEMLDQDCTEPLSSEHYLQWTHNNVKSNCDSGHGLPLPPDQAINTLDTFMMNQTARLQLRSSAPHSDALRSAGLVDRGNGQGSSPETCSSDQYSLGSSLRSSGRPAFGKGIKMHQDLGAYGCYESYNEMPDAKCLDAFSDIRLSPQHPNECHCSNPSVASEAFGNLDVDVAAGHLFDCLRADSCETDFPPETITAAYLSNGSEHTSPIHQIPAESLDTMTPYHPFVSPFMLGELAGPREIPRSKQPRLQAGLSEPRSFERPHDRFPDLVGRDQRVRNSNGATKLQRRASRDEFLVRSKLAGMSYKEIRERGGFSEAESTLRGRFRALTKEKHDRVRKPTWRANDIRLLKRAVKECLRDSDISGSRPAQGSRVSWKRVAEYITFHGGSYRFGNATCKKKWMEIQSGSAH